MNRRLLFPVFSGAIALLLLGIVMLRRHDTLEGGYATIGGCIESGDGDCIYRYMMEDERNAYGIKPADISKLVQSYVRPSFYGLQRLAPIVDLDSQVRTLIGDQEFLTKEGRIVHLTFSLSETEDGVRAPNLLASLVLSCADARYYDPADEAGGMGALRRWLRQAKADRAPLSALGLNGIFREGGPGFQTWDEWRAACETRLVRAAAFGKT